MYRRGRLFAGEGSRVTFWAAKKYAEFAKLVTGE
jgi:hypothetical protein